MGNRNEGHQETSLLVKAIVGGILTLLLIPMMIFTALPNMFFGYSSSETENIIHMTQQAMDIGGIYMSLEDFENTYIDSVVTGLVSEYEQQGITIDNIEVSGSLEEDDLLWFIAINSAAYKQDLNTMSADSIRAACTSRLRCMPSLRTLTSGDTVFTTLKVDVRKLNPGTLMDSLGFDEDARVWAGALYEILSESGALTKYAPYFEANRPSYSGDNSYTGGVQHGTSCGTAIDLSGFISPNTKNNLDLTAYVIQAWENNWGYVWGTFGDILTESLFDYKLRQYPDGVGNYESFIRTNWLGRRTADCIGLIKGYGWLNSGGSIRYGTNGMPDCGADQMYRSATEKGPMSTMPEIPGLAVWKNGHIGVYIGGGYVIEAMGTRYGVVKTQVAGRNWQGWCKIPYIDYIEN